MQWLRLDARTALCESFVLDGVIDLLATGNMTVQGVRRSLALDIRAPPVVIGTIFGPRT
jgi:hypothetical protein